MCTGVRAQTCPWAGFYDDDVQLVRVASSFWPNQREYYGDDPEWWLVEAVAFYHHALERAARVVREKPKGPDGIEVTQRSDGGVSIRG